VKAVLLRLVLAATAWSAGLAARQVEQPTAAVSLPGLLRALSGGEASWACAAGWGWRGEWVASATADRQRAPDGCGPAALAAVLRQSRPGMSQELLWSICRQPAGGTTLGRMAWPAQRFGVRCHVCWVPDPTQLPCPAIVHLRRGHFVVLQRYDGARAWVLDPACGVVRVPQREFVAHASGAALVFEPANGPTGATGANHTGQEDS
jgi:hypothetical protein